MKKCKDCKHSVPYEHNELWDESYQKAYDEEVSYNEEILNRENHYSYMSWPRFFWHDMKARYDREEAKKATHIVCKCMPTFVERKKDDVCGQFVWRE